MKCGVPHGWVGRWEVKRLWFFFTMAWNHLGSDGLRELVREKRRTGSYQCLMRNMSEKLGLLDGTLKESFAFYRQRARKAD